MRTDNRRYETGGVPAVLSDVGTGLFRATLLFGSMGLGLAMILTPHDERGGRMMAQAPSYGIDYMATGSVSLASRPHFRQWQGPLQPGLSAPCAVFNDGWQRGEC